MSSIIKNYRTLQGTSVSIGIEKYIREEESQPVQVQEEPKLPDIDYQLKLEEATKEAENILSDAKMQAEAILEEAYLQKEKMLQTCLEEINQLQSEAQNKIALEEERVKMQVKQIEEEAYKEKQKILLEAEPEIVKTLQVLLNTIVSDKIVSSTQWLTLLVRRIVEEEHIQEAIKVCVSPETYDLHGLELEKEFKDMAFSIQVEASLTMEGKACLVETSTGNVYYDIEKGLHQVLDEIKILSKISGGE